MEINVSTFGTKGLPKFGEGIYEPGREQAMIEVTQAFNNLTTIVKKYSQKGSSDAALYQFGVHLTNANTWASLAVAGKAVING